ERLGTASSRAGIAPAGGRGFLFSGNQAARWDPELADRGSRDPALGREPVDGARTFDAFLRHVGWFEEDLRPKARGFDRLSGLLIPSGSLVWVRVVLAQSSFII